MDQTADDKATQEARKRRTPSRRTDVRRYKVLISFDGLNLGDEFPVDPDGHAWAQTHVENGYLQDVTAPEEADDERSNAGQS